MSVRAELESLYSAGIAAVEGATCTSLALRSLEATLQPRTWQLLAAGKAAGAMTEGALRVLGDRLLGGFATTRDEPEQAIGPVRVARAGHPLPDARSVSAAEQALALASAVRSDVGLLVLISGGTSALWAAPAPGLTLDDKRALTEALLQRGAPIESLNAVRRRLSRIKGGGLLRGCSAAHVVTVAISDVPGDVPEVIGSGPTVADRSTYTDALDAVRAAGALAVAPAATAHLEAGAQRWRGARLASRARGEYVIAGSLQVALDAVAASARALGLRTLELGRMLDSDVRALAAELAMRARVAQAQGAELLCAGGEPTVRVVGSGRGGRAQELALAFALEIEGVAGISALFAGTDGSDGNTDVAGAYVDGDTARHARALGVDPRAALHMNDSHAMHRVVGGLFHTGPTRTNVADLALIRLRTHAESMR